MPAPTLPQAPWGPGSHLSGSLRQSSPDPGAARLASRTEAPAPSSHETRAGTVQARVVQGAVTLWRLPPPPRAHGVLAAGTRRRGVRGIASLRLSPRRARLAGGSLGAGRAPGRVRPGQRTAVSAVETRSPSVLSGRAETSLLLQKVERVPLLPEVFVIKYSVDPEGQGDQRFLDLYTHYLGGEEKCISFWLQRLLS